MQEQSIFPMVYFNVFSQFCLLVIYVLLLFGENDVGHSSGFKS